MGRFVASKEAVEMYAHGWRAGTLNFEQWIFKPNEGAIKANRDAIPDLWGDLCEIQILCNSWKERHAKGVPVKMTEQDADKCMLAAKDGVYYVRMYSGEPEVHVFDSTDKDPSNAIPTVRFCNFRYKPEWLEKKGQTNN